MFVAVADRYVKEGGRLALVLPQAVASGVAWKPTRELFAEKYVMEVMVVSHDPQRWNFSDSTELQRNFAGGTAEAQRREYGSGKNAVRESLEESRHVIDAVTFFPRPAANGTRRIGTRSRSCADSGQSEKHAQN